MKRRSPSLRALFASLAAASGALLLTTGCASSATSGAFQSYAGSFAKAEAAAAQGDLAGVAAVYGPDLPKENGAALLANWEMGGFYQTAGRWEESRARLDWADRVARAVDGRAVVSLSEAAETAGSLLTNDNVIEFRGDGYERVMSRTLNALNYLRAGDLDGARVEIRKADEYQQLELARHESDLAEARKSDAAWKAANEAESGPDMSRRLAGMDTYSAGVKSSFVNPFTSFLSGLVYELLGEDDAAYIDYRRALELAPNALAVQSAAFSLALRTGDSERIAEYRRALDPAVTKGGRRAGKGEGEVVVLFQTGLVPKKAEIKFPLPIPGASLAWVAFPCYVDLAPVPDYLEASSGDASEQTEPVADIGVLAVKALKEKWLPITVRQIARIAAKQVVQRQAEIQARKSGGDGAEAVASILGIIYSAVSERADLRAWYSLPARIEAARLVLPAGKQEVRLAWVRGDGSRISTSVAVDVAPGRRALVSVRSFAGAMTAWSLSP